MGFWLIALFCFLIKYANRHDFINRHFHVNSLNDHVCHRANATRILWDYSSSNWRKEGIFGTEWIFLIISPGFNASRHIYAFIFLFPANYSDTFVEYALIWSQNNNWSVLIIDLSQDTECLAKARKVVDSWRALFLSLSLVFSLMIGLNS